MARLQISTLSQLKALLRADFSVQLRRGRSGIITVLTPLILIFALGNASGKRAQLLPATDIVAASFVIGIMGICLAGYSVAIAQDRAAGIFQRLRVTPTPVWAIMVSRLLVQLMTVAIMAVLLLVVAYWRLHLSLGLGHDLVTIAAALFGGCAFLALGQVIAALVRSTNAVNSAGRLVYIALTFGGIVGSVGVLGTAAQNIVAWSPYGTTATIMQAALRGTAGVDHVWWSLLATVAYAILFTAIGVRYFVWEVE
jgi:ABC-2 type transport system permease protein